MSQELAPYLDLARAHPYLTAATLLYLALMALGNVEIKEETAVKWPRFASLWVVAQKTGLVLRGVLKPLLGIALPSAARQVVEQLWPGALTSTSQRTPTVPPSSGGS